jgi:hypothetical protein
MRQLTAFSPRQRMRRCPPSLGVPNQPGHLRFLRGYAASQKPLPYRCRSHPSDTSGARRWQHTGATRTCASRGACSRSGATRRQRQVRFARRGPISSQPKLVTIGHDIWRDQLQQSLIRGSEVVPRHFGTFHADDHGIQMTCIAEAAVTGCPQPVGVVEASEFLLVTRKG